MPLPNLRKILKKYVEHIIEERPQDEKPTCTTITVTSSTQDNTHKETIQLPSFVTTKDNLSDNLRLLAT